MIGLDTNVLVRYFAQDDPGQARIAEDVIDALTEASPGYVSLVTLSELVWVLKSSYSSPPNELLDIVSGLLTSQEIRLQEADVVRSAMGIARSSRIDFPDALICQLGLDAGCTATVTFDRKASVTEGMDLLTGN